MPRKFRITSRERHALQVLQEEERSLGEISERLTAAGLSPLTSAEWITQQRMVTDAEQEYYRVASKGTPKKGAL